MALFDTLFGRNRKQQPDKPQPQPPETVEPLDIEGEDDEVLELDKNDEFLHSGTWMHLASSNVEAMRYIVEDEILELEFKNGSYYQYYEVPYDIARGMIETLSPGRYVWNVLRDKYPYALVTALSQKIPKSKQRPTVVRVRRDLG